MNTLLKMAGAMLLGSNVLVAQDAAPAEPPVQPENKAESIDAIIKEYNEAQSVVSQKFHAAKTDKERQEIMKSWQNTEVYAKRIMAVVASDPKSAKAPKGLLWVTVRGPAAMKEEAFEMMLKDYADSKEMVQYASYLGQAYARGEDKLKRIIDKASSKEVKRSAKMCLANLMDEQADMLEDEAKAKAKREEALAMLRDLVREEKEDASSPELLAKLEQKIFQIERLSVGAEAPDIVGTDHDGQEFKLSDYRGKVVLLDFWGYW